MPRYIKKKAKEPTKVVDEGDERGEAIFSPSANLHSEETPCTDILNGDWYAEPAVEIVEEVRIRHDFTGFPWRIP
jgi:hypothetical protein